MRWIENALFPLSSGAQPQDYPEPESEDKASLAGKVAWLLFCGVSLQLAFLQPSIILLHGERTNLFSGLLCALSLGATVWAARKGELVKSPGEAAIYLLLTGLLLLSGFTSAAPLTNTFRGLVLLASGLGGFWGARVLLATPARQRSFLQLSLLMLSGILLVGLVSYEVSSTVTLAMDPKYHSLATKIMLLWFAPLTLLWGRIPQKILGALLIGLSYLLFSLTELRSAMLLPLIMGLLAVFWGRLRLRYFFMILLAASVILFFFIRQLPPEKIDKTYEPAYYRVEYYPLSWHIAKQHPWLGIGLLTPREDFLKDYEIKYPYVTREQFSNSLRDIKVADNMFLTFMVGVGFPFLLLYCFSLIKLLGGLRGSAAKDTPTPLIPRLAIILPVSATFFSFFIYDILLHPQVCWFFYVLLGLIPRQD
ncbi:MAG: O-antigen ligase family protein [Deltaproteobacteria bacterium]|nr:O-antigen ligase family protein [Deltaproteobacteria bacterium]